MKRKDELKHFGIKGMKWGVWNKETRRRYEGDEYDPSKDTELSPYNPYTKDQYWYNTHKYYKTLAGEADKQAFKGKSWKNARYMAKAAEYMREADKALKKVDSQKLKEFKQRDAKRSKGEKAAEKSMFKSNNAYAQIDNFMDIYKEMNWNPDEHYNDPDFEEQEHRVVDKFLKKHGITKV